jgi:cell division protein FtsQ
VTVVESEQRFAQAAPRRPWLRWLLLAAAGAAAAAAVWLVWFSPVLAVREVRVLGAQAVPVDEIRGAAGRQIGTPLARVDADGIGERVGAIPQVGAVEVRRGWPDVLVVVVSERTPIAVVRADGGYAYVDATGAQFGSLPARPSGLPLVRAAGPQARASAVGVLAAIPPAERTAVTRVVAATPDDVVLTWGTGGEGGESSAAQVQWGSPERSDRKLAVLLALLARRAAFYDVSAPDLPTTRGRLGS